MVQLPDLKPQQKTKAVYLTPQGLAILRSELHFLQTEKRSEISIRLQQARELDDTDENAEYDAAIEEQTMVDNRISELEETLAHAQMVKSSLKSTSDIVQIGSVVVIDTAGSKQEFTLVGKAETNPALKKISHESPMGEALMGAKVGDVVTVNTPLKSYQCKIIEIK